MTVAWLKPNRKTTLRCCRHCASCLFVSFLFGSMLVSYAGAQTDGGKGSGRLGFRCRFGRIILRTRRNDHTAGPERV